MEDRLGLSAGVLAARAVQEVTLTIVVRAGFFRLLSRLQAALIIRSLPDRLSDELLEASLIRLAHDLLHTRVGVQCELVAVRLAELEVR